ncbi:MAG: flagellar biosynthesis protein FliQ [Oscillospiraceae bacterium]|nr:flagellar biosynthesis protein FliQ [Oscillospiraceae bacterium]
MSEQAIVDVLRAAFIVAMKLSAPLLLVSLGVGLIISVFQAATQIHEQTLTFVPKLIVIGIILILLAPWMMTVMKEYVISTFQNILNFM